ncbi:MAG: valine--tRNA ligase [Methanobrevibacter sp.]|uniref:valine--tRNA ligase n=1 Tax=Methanobrevibacter TaxID=2172 RepID=UPI0025F2C154|nr:MULTISPECIES: valine--tRNA ligase [Methanobrevibacter]MBS7257015.1 valine--tRNA ligase [Methanobrevibacter sp.]MCI7428100.1 valine--tRNA ligase [Methanobrevibacter sp.]MDY3096349.1 valine--tRNA ligase [Methanobrevibacter sp.]
MSNEEIPKDYDFKREKFWEKKWEDEDIYKYIGDGSRPRYIIDTPPPYPTGLIHLGHVLNWVYIDMNARYRRLKGHDVLFPQGWDCHGLPTEVKVEETHGIKKNDVSRAKFREYCVDLTTKNIASMKSQMKSMGFSQDWNREFITMTPEYMRRTQYSFLKMYNEGLIYQGIHPVNWCPRCETAIAFAEVEYSDNTTFLNYVNFPPAVEDSYDDIASSQASGKQADPKTEGILIATTRPELMSACVAVVIHPEDERYTHLLGKYVEVPLSHQKVKIIADEEVDPEFGTGAVMICTFGDKTDVSWVNKYDLEIIDAIDESGKLTDAAGRYAGMDLQSCKKQTISDLDAEGYLVKQEQVDQNVGQCWRCKTPIEILVKKQWFVAVRDLIQKTKDAADEMNWMPEHMKSRMVNWADSMEWDWCISRQRIFATPIPVWYCKDCGKVILPDVEDLPIDPTQDKPKHACECGCEEFIGEEDVLDTWMDSSISPLSIAGWPDEDYVNHFPADIRPQGHDIIRTWTFYTTLRCLALTDQKPFSDVVINGMVFGEDGYKMSKSRGNVIGPEEVIEQYGADALRTWAANSVPGSDVIFDWKDIKHGYRFIRKFWNAFRFISMQIFDEEVSYEEVKDNLDPLDMWILSKLNNLNITVDNAFAQYNFADTIGSIEKFFWHDFCDEYIEAVKYRLYSDVSDESRKAAKYTLRCVIETSLKLLSPIVPFFVEEVYQYFDDQSIHTTSWPEVNEELISEEMEVKGETTIELIDEVRRFKSASKIPLNAELSEVNVYTSDEDLVDVFNLFDDDIRGTLKINDLNISSGKPEVHEKIIEVEPDMSQIGPKYKGDAGKIIGYLKSTDIEEIASVLEESQELTIGDIVVPEDMLNIKKEIVGASGKKVDILQSENLDMIVEVIR